MRSSAVAVGALTGSNANAAAGGRVLDSPRQPRRGGQGARGEAGHVWPANP